jgi:hypothetical protein
MAESWQDYFQPGEALLWEGAPKPGVHGWPKIIGLALFGLPFLIVGIGIFVAGLKQTFSGGTWGTMGPRRPTTPSAMRYPPAPPMSRRPGGSAALKAIRSCAAQPRGWKRAETQTRSGSMSNPSGIPMATALPPA